LSAPSEAVSPPAGRPPRRWIRWVKRLAVVVFLGLAFFLLGFVPYFMVDRIAIKGFALPDRENTAYVANEFKVAKEDIQLTTSDGVSISGWFIPAEGAPRGSVVMVHGLNRTRIEMAKKVEPLHARGFNCILIDLRNHGASGKYVTSFGLKEKLDVRAAVDFAISKAPVPVALWGVSMGGASVTLEAAEDPRVVAVITDSSYDSLNATTRHHLHLFRGFRVYGIPAFALVPTGLMSDLVLFWMKRRGGFQPGEVDVLAAAAKLQDRPTLFVANRGDARVPYQIAENFAKLAGTKSRVLLTDSKSHGGAWRDARVAYEAAVVKLLDEAVPPPVEGAASKVETSSARAGVQKKDP
jgi:uncharacterized protein